MKRFFYVILICAICFTATAQEKYNKYASSYNYSKAVELYNEGDNEGAKAAILKELEEHPDHGRAYLFLGSIYYDLQSFGEALTACDKAIKYINKKDKEGRAYAYNCRGEIYKELGENEQALSDYSTAISLWGTSDTFYADRAQLYYEMDQYELSDADYKAMLKLDEHDAYARMGIGRNNLARQEYDKAVDVFDYVIALYPNYSSAYSFRAEAKFRRQEYTEAASDIVKALSIDRDDKAFRLMQMMADSSFTHISTKLKSQAVIEPNVAYWTYCLGTVNETVEKYEQAIQYYDKSAKLDANDITYYRISHCYEELGNWSSAIENVEKAITMDPDYYLYYLAKSILYYDMGDMDSSLEVMDYFIEKYPDYYYGYSRRGWLKRLLKDIDSAISDYTTTIELNPDYTYAYVMRGQLYLEIGDTSSAEKDFEEVIKKDTVAIDGSCAHYSLFYLGRVDEAKEWFQKVFESRTDESGRLYDAACFYSIIGEVSTSIEYLEKSLLKGYKEMFHILNDPDLNNIREDSRYKLLIDAYSKDTKLESQANTKSQYVEKVSEVPFTRSGGVTKVKCEINGLPLHFVFDTGAADVTISRVEATFMFKNDILTAKDIVGKARYIDANGDISVGTVINLRKVSFAGMELENVKASVVNSNNAPLLLGQTVLSRLGKVEIDYDRSVLKITTKTKAE